MLYALTLIDPCIRGNPCCNVGWVIYLTGLEGHGKWGKSSSVSFTRWLTCPCMLSVYFWLAQRIIQSQEPPLVCLALICSLEFWTHCVVNSLTADLANHKRRPCYYVEVFRCLCCHVRLRNAVSMNGDAMHGVRGDVRAIDTLIMSYRHGAGCALVLLWNMVLLSASGWSGFCAPGACK